VRGVRAGVQQRAEGLGGEVAVADEEHLRGIGGGHERQHVKTSVSPSEEAGNDAQNVYGGRVRSRRLRKASGPVWEEFAVNAGVGRGVFWGLMAAGALVTVLAVMVLVGYLVGHNTHTVTKTVTVDTALVRSVPSLVSFG
jgi:hypothetical protein